MASKQRAGSAFKAGYKAYANENRWLKNKIAKLEKTVKFQPENEQAKEALALARANKVTYTRSRRSTGHVCKGMYAILGFENNKPSDGMKKAKLDLHWFFGGAYKFKPSAPKPLTPKEVYNVNMDTLRYGQCVKL